MTLKNMLLVLVLFNLFLFAQQPENLFKGLGQGILRGTPGLVGWNEYLVPGRLEIPRSYLPETFVHPRFIPMSGRGATNSGWQEIVEFAPVLRRIANVPGAMVRDKARWAKLCAILYRLTWQASYLEEGKKMLISLPEAPEIVSLEGGRSGEGWGEFLESAEAIPDLVVAYDGLAEFLTDEEKAGVERKIFTVIGQLRKAIWSTTRNNHTIVFGVAITMAAMGLDHPENYLDVDRNRLYHEGLNVLSESLGAVSPDGGYPEGSGYAVYILNFVVQMATYQQYLMGESVMDNPVLQRLMQWTLDHIRPTGELSRFDDSYQWIHPAFILLLPYFRKTEWHWERWIPMTERYLGYHTLKAEVAIFQPDAFCPSTKPREGPAGKGFPLHGDMVFRDNEYLPNILGVFLAENPEYFSDVHEHVDPLSFELSTVNGSIFTNGGYGKHTSDPDRFFYLSDRSTSGILVNGRGPDGNPFSDDEIHPFWRWMTATEETAVGEAEILVQGVRVNRMVYFQKPGIFLILDRSLGARPHTLGSHFLTPLQISVQEKNRYLLHGEKASTLLMGEGLRSDLVSLHGAYDNELSFLEFESLENVAQAQTFLVIPDYDPVRYPIVENRRPDENPLWEIRDLSRGDRLLIYRQKGSLQSLPGLAVKTDASISIYSEHFSKRREQLTVLDAMKIRWDQLEIEANNPMEMTMVRWAEGFELVVSGGEGVDSVRVLYAGRDHILVEGTPVSAGVWIPVYGEMRLSSGTIREEMVCYRKEIPTYQNYAHIMGFPEGKPVPDFIQAEREAFIAGKIQQGIGAWVQHESNRLTGDSLLLGKTAHAILGLAKYNYLLYDDRYRIKIPHLNRTAWDSEKGIIEIQQTGEYTDQGWRIRTFSAGWKNGSSFFHRLQYLHLKDDEYSVRWASGVMGTLVYGGIQLGEVNHYSAGFYGNEFPLSGRLDWDDGRISMWEADLYLGRIVVHVAEYHQGPFRGYRGKGDFTLTRWFRIFFQDEYRKSAYRRSTVGWSLTGRRGNMAGNFIREWLPATGKVTYGGYWMGSVFGRKGQVSMSGAICEDEWTHSISLSSTRGRKRYQGRGYFSSSSGLGNRIEQSLFLLPGTGGMEWGLIQSVDWWDGHHRWRQGIGFSTVMEKIILGPYVGVIINNRRLKPEKGFSGAIAGIGSIHYTETDDRTGGTISQIGGTLQIARLFLRGMAEWQKNRWQWIRIELSGITPWTSPHLQFVFRRPGNIWLQGGVVYRF